jgi:assimilatory nitrate reductase catalytic subunit
VHELSEAEPESFVELHPDMARGLGIGAGDLVRLSTRRGTVDLPARISRDIRMDTVFVPFHWGGAQRANLLTNAAVDAVSRIPEFKACAVQVQRVPHAHPASG